MRRLAGIACVFVLFLGSATAHGQEPGGDPEPLSIEKTGPAFASEGVQYEYEITVTGDTPAPADLTIEDIMPRGASISGLTVEEGSADCRQSTPSKLSCTGVKPPFKIRVKVVWVRTTETGDRTTLVNTATMMGTNFPLVRTPAVETTVLHTSESIPTPTPSPSPSPTPRPRGPDCAVKLVATASTWKRNAKNAIELLVENHGDRSDTCFITYKVGGLTFVPPAKAPGSISLGPGQSDILTTHLKPQDVAAKGGQTIMLIACATAGSEVHPVDDCLPPGTTITVGTANGGGGPKQPPGKKAPRCEVSVRLLSVSIRSGDDNEHTLSITTTERHPVGVRTTTDVKVTEGTTTTVDKKIGADEIGGGAFPLQPQGSIKIVDSTTGSSGTKRLEGSKIDGPPCPGSLSRAYRVVLDRADEGSGSLLVTVIYRWDAVLVE